MPKKGKGKKKGGKGKDKKDDGPPPPKVSAEEESLNEDSRQFYAVQIKDLEERVGRYQERCAALQVSNDELQSKLTQQEEDQGQVIQFLKKKTKDQALSAAALEGELETVRRVREEEREQLEAQMAQQKEEDRRAQDKLQEENGVLQRKLDDLEEFRLNKERLEEESREMAEEIERLKKEKEDVVYSLEKKAVLDRDKMKKEMVSKVNLVAGEFRKVSDLQMVETTKRTIRENVTISQQLGKMSEKTMALLRENEVLRRKETEMSRGMELLEVSHREMTRKNVSNQKVIQLLQEKAREQERELEELRYTVTQCVKLERQAQQAMEHANTTTLDSKLYRERSQSVEAELARVQAQLADARREIQSLTTILTQSAHTIQTALQGSSSEAEHVAKRQGLLSTLLQLLTSSPLTRSTPSHLTPYTPGDLGIVPHCGKRGTPANYPIHQNSLQLPKGRTM